MSKLFDMATEIFWKLTSGQVIDIIDPGIRYGDYEDKNLHIIVGYTGSLAFQDLQARKLRNVIYHDTGIMLDIYSTAIHCSKENLELIVTFYAMKGLISC